MPTARPPFLLAQRRFAPLFLTQFCGAFNDNLFKNALLLLLAFHSGPVLGLAPAVVVQLAAGLFVLPFFLFSATAGQLADLHDKARLIRWIKLAEIMIAALATAGFAFAHAELLLAALFLMGLHSTFFGPLKYSILPQHLAPDELVAGNAWVESATFVAILAGSLVAGFFMALKPGGALWAGLACVAIAVAGYLAARAIPAAPPSGASTRLNLNPFTETARNLRLVRAQPLLWSAVLALSWFWFYGALFLTQFAPYVKEVLGGEELLVTLLLSTFIVGIALGAFLCNRFSGRQVETGLVLPGALGLSLAALDLWAASPATPGSAASLGAFLATPGALRILLDLTLIGAAGGFFTVPLYALLQQAARPEECSRVIAANNILNAAFMVAAAAFGALALGAGLSVPELFAASALLNALMALYLIRREPHWALRSLALAGTRLLYRLRCEGLEHIPASGPALLVCNHVSFVDAMILYAACRRPIRFVIDHRIYRTPGFHWLFRATGAIPVAGPRDDRARLEAAYAAIAAALAAGELVGLFPEGGITRNGELAAFKGGLQRILRHSPVPVVPMALRGLWGSFFSRKGGGAMRRPLRRGAFNRVELIVAAPLAPEAAQPASLHATVLALRGEWR